MTYNFYKSIHHPLKKTSQIKGACKEVSVYFCTHRHKGQLPAHHCRQKQGLAQPLKKKANEDSASMVNYKAPAFAGEVNFLSVRRQVQFVWYARLYCCPIKQDIYLQIHLWLEASLGASAPLSSVTTAPETVYVSGYFLWAFLLLP